jgi:uncharacterized protein (TIGR03083 family)
MTNPQPADLSRDEFMARMHSSWTRWLAAIEGLTEDQAQTPGTCGEWSVKDLIGHVAVWDTIAIDKIQGILAGAERPVVAETTDEFNARTAEAFRDESLHELRARMNLVHARLIRVLEEMSDVSDEQVHWVSRAISDDTWQHYDEHCQQVIGV